MAQNISIAYLSPLTSSAINNKFALLLGANLVYTGYNAVAGVGTSVSLVRGSDSIQQLFINGVTITEDGDLTNIITIPANSTGSTRTDIIYAQYVHGNNATCTYGIATGTTTLPNGNCCLIATLSVPNGFSSVSSVTITQAQKMLDFNSLKYANRGNAQSTYQIDVTNNGPKLKNNSGTLEIRNATDTGYANVTANAFTSTVATGTAPFVVNSTTKVVNLNSDLLDGYGTATDSTASSVAVRDSGGNLSANSYTSTVATGAAPFTVASTTKVVNLNADLLDGYTTGTGSTASTIAVRDASGNLTTNIFTSTVATGSAPFIVASTTKVANLNADQVDGHDAGNAANNVLVLDASGLVPVANLPTTSASATTTSQTFQLQSGSGGVVLKNNAGVLEVRNSTDTAYADMTVNNINIMGSVNEVSTTTVNIQDNTIYLNSNLSSSTAPSANAGVEVNRGSSTAASLLWNESAQKWYAGLLGSEQAIVLTNDGRLANLSGTGTLAWSYLTSKPTTISGYGITDAVNKTGDTMTGTLTSPGITLTGDIVNDGNERHFRATGTNINWGFYVNGGQFGGYDWINSRSVFQYLPSTGVLNLMNNYGSVATKNNTLDNGSGNITAAGTIQGTQLKSTVATGTAPLTVTSTTKVTNLNADQIDGVDITGIVQNAGNIVSMQGGLDASRPAAGTAGRLYVATDTYQIYRDNGVSWDTVGGVKPVVSTAQPTTGLIDGLVWYNSASGVTKMYLNGAFRDISNSAITFLRNTTTLASDATSVAIGIPSFNPSSMSMLVYANSTYIEVGDSQDGYSFNADNTKINKVTGTWKAGTVFNFVAFATVSGNPNLLGVTCLTSSFTATSDGTTHCLINNSNFNKNTDVLKVYHGNIPLFANDNYTINADNVSIDLTYSLNNGDKINYEIWKNIAVSANFSDGSILAAGSVSNAALASDAKVGSLALLTTNAKSDVVSAVNEVAGNLYTPSYQSGVTVSSELNVLPATTINKQVKITDIQGKTIMNLLANGNCEDTSKWIYSNATIALDGSTYVNGSNSIKVTSTSASSSAWLYRGAWCTQVLQPNSYYCFTAYVKNGTMPGGINLQPSGSGFTVKTQTSSTDTTKFVRIMCLFSTGATISADLDIWATPTAIGQYYWVDSAMVEQITQAQYNLGSSYVPSPYVDEDLSVGDTPTRIKVRGKNLINLVQGSYLTTGAGAFGANTTRITHKDGRIVVKPSTTYTFSLNSPLYYILSEYDTNGNFINAATCTWSSSAVTSLTYTMSANTRYFSIAFKVDTTDTTVIFAENYQIQMEEGSVATTYEPYKESYMTIYQPLRSLSNGTYDEITNVNGNNKVITRVNRVTIDGTMPWLYNSSTTGFKRVGANIITGAGWMYNTSTTGTGFAGNICLKYNNKILADRGCYPTTSVTTEGVQYWSNGSVYIDVATADSGWGDSYTPSVAEMQAYFFGYKMNNGTFGTAYNGSGTKTWTTMYATDNTSAVTTCPTSIASGYNPYVIYYQYATPSILSPTYMSELVMPINGSMVMENDSQSWIRPQITYQVVDNIKANLDDIMTELNELKRQYSNIGAFYTNGNPDSEVPLRTVSPDGSMLFMGPNLNASNYSPMTQTGDQGIFFNSKRTAYNATSSALVIAPWSSVPAGLRLTGNGSVKTGNGTYLDDGNGNITFANRSDYAFRGVYGTVGDNDFWRVGGGATTGDSGYMEIATADNGTEPIYVRQYNGNFTTGSPARTATLLDGSGNTVFPGALSTGGNINVGGILSMATSNAGVELGNLSASNTPYVDFHSSGNNIDYDVRLMAGGGSASTGQGTLNMYAANLCINSYHVLRALSGGYKVQSGVGSVTYGTSGSQTSTTITFPVAFGSNPVVAVGYAGGLLGGIGYINTWVDSSSGVTTTTAQVNFAAYTTGTFRFWWIAIGV